MHPYNIIMPQLLGHINSLHSDLQSQSGGITNIKHVKRKSFSSRKRPMGSVEDDNLLGSSSSMSDDFDPNDILSLTRRCLTFAGEEVDKVMPLLNSVLPIEVKENNFTNSLGPDGRTYLLKALITRLINYFTRFQPLALLMDDLHW
jgi:hypothetical protein